MRLKLGHGPGFGGRVNGLSNHHQTREGLGNELNAGQGLGERRIGKRGVYQGDVWRC